MADQITYTEATERYNERRYGKPWMARLTDNLTHGFLFIDWNGRPGYDGEFSFKAEPGTLLAYGQKDLRKNKGGIDGYQICLPDGTMASISDQQALAALKLPVAERVACVARLKLAYYEPQLALALAHQGEPDWAKHIEDEQKAVDRWKAFTTEVK